MQRVRKVIFLYEIGIIISHFQGGFGCLVWAMLHLLRTRSKVPGLPPGETDVSKAMCSELPNKRACTFIYF